MKYNRRYRIFVLLMLAAAMLVGACSQEEIYTSDEGTLHLSIGHDVCPYGTRAIPAQLGQPLAEKFKLRVQRSGSERVFYDGEFVENLELGIGTYNVTACYGDNVLLGKDTPYYEGMATAVIEKDKSTSVTVPCRVANALISVAFGRNEEERARFDRYYTDFGLLVRIGDHSLAISSDDTGSSIYFPAGSNPTLLFYGTLKGDGELVWREVSSDALPETFAAADHAVITLSLPAPASALNVNIVKAELETVTISETIPLTWLPAPAVTVQHSYDNDGILVGTDLEFSNSFPGMQWKTVVTNSAGEEVRSVEGRGELLSSYRSSSEWPYLPSGNYKAIFYVIDGESVNKVNSKDFSVGKPKLYLTFGGYSSYTKYLEGDIDAANNCDPNTVYSPSVRLNVSETLLSNSKYSYSFTCQYASMPVEHVPVGKNSWTKKEPLTSQNASFTPYRLNGNAMFDGVSLSEYKDFYITGLPVTYAPPTKENGWTSSGKVVFNGSDVKLGGWDAGSSSIANTNLAIPQYTTVALDYDVSIGTSWGGNSLSITIGNSKFFSQDVGSEFIDKQYPYKDTSIGRLTENTTEVKCHNSNSAGLHFSFIYSLSLKYSK